jgi:hypothetical protein
MLSGEPFFQLFFPIFFGCILLHKPGDQEMENAIFFINFFNKKYTCILFGENVWRIKIGSNLTYRGAP